MKHDLEIEGKSISVSLDKQKLTVGEETLEVAHHGCGQLLLADGRSLEYALERLPRGELKVHLLGQEVTVRRPGRGAATGGAGGSGNVSAPMNGQVVKILRQTGDTVASGEVILVLEAMKMENEVTAPLGGRLEALQVKPGQAVAPGDLLFRIQPET